MFVSCKRYIRCAIALALALSACATIPPAPRVLEPPSEAPDWKVSREPGKPIVALALGGGAARGFAHIGVLEVLEKHQIVPDLIVGTSAGALVGAFYAGGIRNDKLIAAANELQKSDIADVTWPDRGVVAGEALQAYVNKALYWRPFEELQLPFAAVATDLRSGKYVAFTRGNVGMAVRASSAVPAVFQPVTIRGREYVDGGLTSVVPVRAARALGADIIIAVDVTKRPDIERELSGTADIVRQSYRVVMYALTQADAVDADVIVQPAVSDIGAQNFDERHKAIEAGRSAAETTVNEIRRLIDAHK